MVTLESKTWKLLISSLDMQYSNPNTELLCTPWSTTAVRLNLCLLCMCAISALGHGGPWDYYVLDALRTLYHS